MVSKPKVSVVTITYNHERYIREALDSFVAQRTDFSFEVVVADDCSTDRTPEIIAEYAEKYPAIIRPILRKKNIGAIKNSIDALSTARGTYIAMCEGDDYWTDPTKLQRQADFMDAHPECGLSFHLVRVVSEDKSKEEYLFPDLSQKPKFTREELLRGNFIQTNAVMYRKQTYTSMPDDVLPLDWYLHLYHAQFGEIGFIKREMAAYRRHPGGMWWNSDRDTDEIWKRHGLAHLALYVAFLRLYGDNGKYRAIILRHITNMLNNLISVDQKHATQLLHEALRRYPELVEPFVVMQHVNFFSELHQKNIIIDKLTQQVQGKNSILAERDKEIATMKASKFWKMQEHYVQAKTYVTHPGDTAKLLSERLHKKG